MLMLLLRFKFQCHFYLKFANDELIYYPEIAGQVT
jgi:hypothetical protein